MSKRIAVDEVMNKLLYVPFNDDYKVEDHIKTLLTEEEFFSQCFVDPEIDEEIEILSKKKDGEDGENDSGEEVDDFEINLEKEELARRLHRQREGLAALRTWISGRQAHIYCVRGDAGTGKTTFLHYLRRCMSKEPKNTKEKLEIVTIAALSVFLMLVGLLLYLFVTLNISVFAKLLKIVAFCICLVLILTVIGLFKKKHIVNIRSVKRVLLAVCSLVLVVAIIFGGVVAASFCIDSPEDFLLKTGFFSDKNVLIFLPHQDDDVNLTGGIIEQYVKNGSTVSIVYSTNGDYPLPASTRFNEATKVLTDIGVDPENIIFLGFGDQWTPQEFGSETINHIYNSPNPDTVWLSTSKYDKTYGTEDVSCYRECAYTRDNYLNCIKSVIKEKRPDVIYCTGYDEHPDHRALDLFFDEAMGQVLREDPTYHPTVYKGFCYETAWEAKGDFFSSFNLVSTQEFDYQKNPDRYRGVSWEDRVRIPMDSGNLNRMLSNNSVYQSFSNYVSQSAYSHATKVLNGDKVFFERRTDSVLYNATIYVDSEKTDVLNDFKVKDSNDITSIGYPVDGSIRGEEIEIVLNNEYVISSISLYDNPDPNSNITKGYILFDDGSRVDFENLFSEGEETRIEFSPRTTQGFNIYITEAAGVNCGLTEIEAYEETAGANNDVVEFLMPVDAKGNFVYDYWVEDGESAEFSLYSYPNKDLDMSEVNIELDGGENCSYEIKDGLLIVNCPYGESTNITITYDTVQTVFSVSNPRTAHRTLTNCLRSINFHYVYAVDALKSYAFKTIFKLHNR